LIKKGWPVGSLLLTVVRDEKGEGHAVLTARTLQGDFILDNKLEEVRLWNQTPYQFVMRQSYLNPRVWVALDTRQSPLATALSGGLELDE
jgi:predicted transglutaminase-like cysteine proteinase